MYTSWPWQAGRLGERGAVEDPAAGQLGAARRVELPVGHAGRQDHGVRGDRRPVGEPHGPRRAVDLQAGHLAGGEDLGAELGRPAAAPGR